MGQQQSRRAFRWGATLFFIGLSACGAPEPDDGVGEEATDVESIVSELGGECRAACAERLHAIAERCRDEGVEPRRCHVRLAEARERCAEACEVREPRRHPPRGCAARCEVQAHHDLRACIADGGEAADCAQAAREGAQACREERCDDRPERPRCEESCAARARAVTAQCIENGGDERACRRRGEAFGRQCAEDHCAPPRNDRGECADRCGAEGREIERECREAGHDGRACRERAARFVAGCIADRCERPQPPPPPPADRCEDACAERARAIGARCLEEGGSRERCAAHAREFAGACVAEHCDGGEQPPPPACQERCGAEGRRIHAECLEAGGAEERCSARAREFVGACVAEHCDGGEEPPPEPPVCEERCGAEGRRIHAECLEAGGAEERCSARAREFVGACVAEHCDGGEQPPPEPPVCEERCGAEGRRIHAACVEAGNDAEACAARARHFVEECTARCGGEEPPPPPPEEPSCEDRCAREGRVAYEQCVAAGHGDDACARRAREVTAACARNNCGGGEQPPPPPPEEPSCEDRCAAATEAFLRECIAAGNAADRCRAAAAERQRACAASCDREPPPPPPEEGPTCADRCEITANEVFRICVERTRDEVACREQRARSIRACIAERCQQP